MGASVAPRISQPKVNTGMEDIRCLGHPLRKIITQASGPHCKLGVPPLLQAPLEWL